MSFARAVNVLTGKGSANKQADVVRMVLEHALGCQDVVSKGSSGLLKQRSIPRSSAAIADAFCTLVLWLGLRGDVRLPTELRRVARGWFIRRL